MKSSLAHPSATRGGRGQRGEEHRGVNRQGFVCVLGGGGRACGGGGAGREAGGQLLSLSCCRCAALGLLLPHGCEFT